MAADGDYRGSRHWSSDRPRPAHLAYLGVVGIEIVDGRGTHSYDPNSILVAFAGRDAHRELEPIEGVASICSGKPAVLYRTHEAEIALTPDEVYRLRMHALTPDEFTAICDAVGVIYEMNVGSYDPETGIAQQPYVPVPGYEHLYVRNEEDELEPMP